MNRLKLIFAIVLLAAVPALANVQHLTPAVRST